MKTQLFIIYGISALSIVLGFIALLKQRNYIDAKTRKHVEIDIPFIGKMKSNYPALVFVFLGIFLAYFAFNKSMIPQKKLWEVKGSFVHPNGDNIDWENGTLTLVPKIYETQVSPQGVFLIDIWLDEGISFEDYVQTIDYTHRCGSIQILPKEEFFLYARRKSSAIEMLTPNYRKYKPVPIRLY